ncbi:trehalose synthase [Tremella mesenterica]|uniref:Trehalose synthase n=1 Tax=Tremella mesenterica TaxID=5217 RepID=A0A4Q1BGG9_TREME|nr:uncharacterized protein TREMEDRAFT_36511 [Tremella mesenterica DSM 1558]EIW72195.1 hypothetical protein TREMEDRAFT_36511 [Tremella mesenterica DSM 1558]RXK36553.1 trehalose synthase [Tremella mesenterica]
MSPHRRMSKVSQRHPSQINDVFLGLAFTLHSPKNPNEPGDLEYTAVLHDGTGVVESEEWHLPFRLELSDEESLGEVQIASRKVLERIMEYENERNAKVCVVAVAEPIPHQLMGNQGVEFFATIWLHLDAVPFLIKPSTSIFTELPAPSTAASAASAISAAILHLHPATHTATTAVLDPVDHHVQVDCNRQVRLCSIVQYQQSTSPELWKRFTALATQLREKDISIAFFSATPQGGGVALMRHALIRLLRMVGVKVNWYVPEGHPVVFDITKRKIHNVLQGVAEKGMEMSDEDKRWFEIWTRQNYEAFWTKGALDADVIVIDDPQLTAMIPIIKRERPNTKIIFRSHIQLQSDLIDNPSTPQARTWNYLYNYVKHADLFLSHPVKFFVPKNVHDNMAVLYMAPSTDPLDGLNKPYGERSVHYFRQYYNSLSAKQCGITVDWDRGYICQVARFDPSKGLEYLLAAYLEFRQKLMKLDPPPLGGGPHLIVMGHGSVDDPDGTRIYEKLHDILASEEYALVKEDVSIVRAPPSDGILGAIMQGAWVATQLSTREGFEVKVTEVVNKRVPIIVSDAGGIPLQVKHGINGWIVPTANSHAVAQTLYDIHQGNISVHRTLDPERKLDGRKTDPNSVSEEFVRNFDEPMLKVHADDGATSEDFWTVGNVTRWLYLFSRLLGLEHDGDETLQSMDIGTQLVGKKIDGPNVWEMVMGKDMVQGEGELI